jgi:hypothetical protein
VGEHAGVGQHVSRYGGGNARRYDWADPTGNGATGLGTRTGEYRCVTCGAETDRDDRGDCPDGWYRLIIHGPFGDDDAHPGRYCSLGCLVAAVLAPYGVTAQQARRWVAGR